MARPPNTDERRTQIAEAMVRVMAKKGCEGASTSAIAEEAGLGQGLIHYHFATKQEILLAAIDRLIAIWERRFEARLREAGDDKRRRVEAFIDAHLALGADADEAAVAAWVVIGAAAVSDAAVRARYAEAMRVRFEVLEDLLRAWMREDLGGTRGAKQLASVIIAAIEGAYQLSATTPGLLPRGFAAPAVRAMLDADFAGVTRKGSS